MNSTLFTASKKLLALTLISGLLIVPTQIVWGEELGEILVESAPVVEIIPAVEVDLLSVSEEIGGETDNVVLDESGDDGEENTFTTPEADGINLLAVSEELSFTLISTPVVDTLSISSENDFTTPTSVVLDTLTVSSENDFVTSTAVVVSDTLAVSAENDFNTLAVPTVDTLSISAENDFNTLTIPTSDTLAISEENSFNTSSGGGGGGENFDTLSISAENDFRTLTLPTSDTLAISEENSFNTGSGGGGGGENSDTLSISAENNFDTLATGGGGGGGGGGSWGGSGSVIVATSSIPGCGLFLKDYIRYGRANDRFEVIKLQAFLRVFEGFSNLPITGVYDLVTFRAVEIFQQRYLRDVLTPWGISDPTGYVYITTRLAINNIYCGDDTRNNLDLRYRFAREYRQAVENLGLPLPADLDEGYLINPTSTVSSVPVIKDNFLLAGLFGVFDFVGANFCWLLNLLLLLLILFLLWLLWLATRDQQRVARDGQENTLSQPVEPIVSVDNSTNLPNLSGAIPLAEVLTQEDEEVLAEIAETSEEQLPPANNNPEQETIPLGPAQL